MMIIARLDWIIISLGVKVTQVFMRINKLLSVCDVYWLELEAGYCNQWILYEITYHMLWLCNSKDKKLF